jgi:2'-5' RNA ligase
MPAAFARVFYGLPLDDALDALAPLLPPIVQEAQGRPVPPANLHATLAFVGSVAPDGVDRLMQIGERLPRAPITLALDTVGSFRGARVAWVAPSRLPPALTVLHDALAARLRDDAFHVEERPYRPHVTVARHCRHTLVTRSVGAVSWRVQRIVLYESIGADDGPRYEPRAEWPLDAAK